MGASLDKYPATLELRRDRAMDRSGLRFGASPISPSCLRPFTRIPHLDRPLCQLGKVGILRPCGPIVWKEITQSVQIVREREFDALQHQSRLERLLRSLLGEPANVTRGRRKSR